MTDKRFIKLLEKEFMIYDNWESKQITDYDTVTDLLNALHEENQMLNSALEKNLKITGVLSDLEKLENWKWEYLLGALDTIAIIVGYDTELLGLDKPYTGSLLDEVVELRKENKQLKSEIKMLQSHLHRATIDSRLLTLKEIKKEIEKMERME